MGSNRSVGQAKVASVKVRLTKKGIISESSRHTKPSAVFQCHMVDTSLIYKLFSINTHRLG